MSSGLSHLELKLKIHKGLTNSNKYPNAHLAHKKSSCSTDLIKEKIAYLAYQVINTLETFSFLTFFRQYDPSWSPFEYSVLNVSFWFFQALISLGVMYNNHVYPQPILFDADFSSVKSRLDLGISCFKE